MPIPPQSPPKRMTRAMARAVEDTKSSVKTTKITTAAAKAAAGTRNTKRKQEISDNDDVTTATEQSTGSAPSQPDFARPTKSQTNRNVANSRPGATTKAPAKNEPKGDISKRGRGRPRKEPVKAQPPRAEDHEDAGPTTRTRARAGSVTANVAPKSAAMKKKVTFEEDVADKENIAPAVAGKKAAVMRGAKEKGPKPSSEPNAKPATKGVVVPTGARYGKTNQTRENGGTAARAEPLSSKKATQVAKGDAVHENEGEETSRVAPSGTTDSPLQCSREYDMDRFPRKDGAVDVGRNADSAKVDLSSESLGQDHSAPSMQTPAKRPPMSPFKNSMKTTPMRLGRSPNKENPTAKFQPPQESMIRQSPPKRFLLGDIQPSFDVSTNATLKSSLLQSPARKPPSPVKLSGFESSVRPSPSKPEFSSSSAVGISGSPQRSRSSPVKNLSCSLKAAKSSTSPFKLYRTTVDEQANFEDELANAPSLMSPVKTTQKLKTTEEYFDQLSSFDNTPKVDGWISDHPTTKQPFHDFPKTQQDETPSKTVIPVFNRDEQSTTPPGLPLNMAKATGGLNVRRKSSNFDDESEDELQSSGPKPKYDTPSAESGHLVRDLDSHTPSSNSMLAAPGPMTTLAQKFGQWKGATPDLRVVEQRRLERPVFSPLGIKNTNNEELLVPEPEDTSVLELDDVEKTSEFEAAMLSNDFEDTTMVDAAPDILTEESLRESQMCEASQEYADENAMMLDPALLENTIVPIMTCTPERVFSRNPQIVHTVSKVPLKPADGDESPLPRPKKRSHSMTGSLSPGGELELQALRQIHQPFDGLSSSMSYGADLHRDSVLTEQLLEAQTVTSRAVSCPGSSTPSGKSTAWSTIATPTRTPRAGLDIRLLSGAVVFVDVHTSEGADASGIFIELLHQMGARCVKQWNWNPRGSFSPEQASTGNADPDTSRIGITHVVFKDGGKRTMEKVREAQGVVQCVGVGWVLDCERENKWLDECEYAIDRSTIPRGGHRRRKSMEPKALSSRQSVTGVFRNPTKTSDLSPTKQFLDLSSPAPRRETVTFPVQERRSSDMPAPDLKDQEAQTTPQKTILLTAFNTPGAANPSEFGSPATPYFLHPESLVQQTCPPKQSQELFFPVTGCIGDQPDSTIRQRLLLARRKSLQFAPKVGSPLSRPNVEFGNDC